MINLKKVISINLVICMIYMIFPVNVFADPVSNIAQAKYSDANNQKRKIDSNQVITQIEAAKDLDVELVPLFTSANIFPLSTTIFPATIINKGKNADSYKLVPDNLQNGLVVDVYRDFNGNGKIDPEDTVITDTGTLAPNANIKVIIQAKDILGYTNGQKPTFNLSAVSNTDGNVKSTKSFDLTVFIPGTGGNPSTSATPNPNPTPSSNPINYSAELRKTVYPSGAAKAGDILTYYLEFTNKNDYIARPVNVIDKLPNALSPVTDSSNIPVASDNGSYTYSADGVNWSNTMTSGIKYVKFTWSTVNPNQKVNAYFRAKISDTVDNGNLENTAFANYKLDLPNGSPNQPTDTNITAQTINSNTAVNTIKNDYSIDGTVYDKKTGLPKEGVNVIIYDKDGKKVGEDITGKTGKYHVPVDGKGTYTVVYQENNGNLIGQSSTTVTKPGITPPPIEILGKVMNSQTKEAIANAKLQLVDSDKNVVFEITTDAEGNYRFNQDKAGNNLKPGTYTVRIVDSQGQVSFAKVQVSVSNGDVILNLDLLVDPFGIVYDALGGEDVRIKGAEVKLITNCDDPNSALKLADLDDGTKQPNPASTDDKGKYQYFLNKEQLTNKIYCLLVHADGYKDRQFLIRTAPSKEIANKYVLEITDEDYKKTLIQNVESVPYKVPLTPLKTFDINKVANKNSIEIGDVVTYSVDATSKLKFKVHDALFVDRLPFGFKYVPDTIYLNGKPAKNISTVENEIDVYVGDVDPGQKITLMYQTRTGIRVSEGASINTVQIEARSPKFTVAAIDPKKYDVISDVAKATVFVKKGVFSKNGAIIGKVYVDTNNNGIQDEGEPGVENVVIYTATGIRIITDSKGKYSIPDLQNGNFIVRLDTSSLPPGFEQPKNESTWIGQDDISQRVYIPESGLAKANFRLVKTKAPDVIAEKPPEGKKDNPLKAVFVYPDKFAIKQIPYITYPDISNNWAKNIIEYESGLEIIHGYPDGNFKPARNISRAETTKLTLVALKSFDIKMGTTLGYIISKDSNVDARLVNSKGNEIKSFYKNTDKKPGIYQLYWDGKDKDGKVVDNGVYTFEVTSNLSDGKTTKLSTIVEVIPAKPNYHASGKADFKDVPDNHWANSFIKVGSDEKLISGYPDNTFKPDNFIPRYEMAVIAVHALNLDMNNAKDDLPFADANEVPQWAKKYVYLAYNKGLLNKFPDDKFYPNKNISRAEIAAFVKQLINKQKIDGQVRGAANDDLNNITIEGKEVNLSKEKSFVLPLNKEFSENIIIMLPDFKLETINDNDFDNKGNNK